MHILEWGRVAVHDCGWSSCGAALHLPTLCRSNRSEASQPCRPIMRPQHGTPVATRLLSPL